MDRQTTSYSWNKDELSITSDDSTEVDSPLQPCATNESDEDLRALGGWVRSREREGVCTWSDMHTVIDVRTYMW